MSDSEGEDIEIVGDEVFRVVDRCLELTAQDVDAGGLFMAGLRRGGCVLVVKTPAGVSVRLVALKTL